MKIILVQPTYPTSPFKEPYLSIGLGYLSEQLEMNDMEHAICDLYVDDKNTLFEKINKFSPEYLGISLMSLDIFYNYKLIEEIKLEFPKVKIIAGGPHLSFVKEKALLECKYIDFGIVNEGEKTLLSLLKGTNIKEIDGLIYRNGDGNINCNTASGFIEGLDGFSFPRYKKFNLLRYGNSVPIISSRGCPFQCTFCGAFLSMGRKYRTRSAGNIIDEITYWYNKGYRNFNFVDSNFFLSKERVMEICDLLEKNKIEISITVDGMRARDGDYEVLYRMKKNGLKSVSLGIESANDEILVNIKKGENLDVIKKCLVVLNDLDIQVTTFFIIGLPGETIRHILNSFKFVLKYKNISNTYFFNLNPLPETELYDWAKKNNFLDISDQRIYRNIGGMGKDILIETPELSRRKRKVIYLISRMVSKFVMLRYRIFKLSKRDAIKHVIIKFARFLKKINYRIFIAKNALWWIDKIHTHLTDEEKMFLYKNVRQRNGVFVEIGSYLGASSSFIAEALRNSKHSSKLYCIDTWENSAMSEGNRDTYLEFIKNTSKYNGIIIPLRGKSIYISKIFDGKIDFIFIDGDHSYEGVKKDVDVWFPKLNEGAMVMFHDVGWAVGVQEVIRKDVSPKVKKEGRLPNLYWGIV